MIYLADEFKIIVDVKLDKDAGLNIQEQLDRIKNLDIKINNIDLSSLSSQVDEIITKINNSFSRLGGSGSIAQGFTSQTKSITNGLQQQQQQLKKTSDALDEYDKKVEHLNKKGEVTKYSVTSTTDESIGEKTTEYYDGEGNLKKSVVVTNLEKTRKEQEKLQSEIIASRARFEKELARFNNKSQFTMIDSQQYKDATKALNDLNNVDANEDDILNAKKALDELDASYNRLVTNLRKGDTSSFNPIVNAQANLHNMPNTINKVELAFQSLKRQPKEVADKITALYAEAEKVNGLKVGTEEWASAYGNLRQHVQDVQNQVNLLGKEQKIDLKNFGFDTKAIKLDNKITTYLRENTRLSKGFRQELLKIQEAIKTADNLKLDKLEQEFQAVTAKAQGADKTGRSFFSEMQHNLTKFASWIGVSTLFFSAVNGVRKLYEAVKEVDTAMVSLRKVTDETDETYQNFLVNASQSAKKLGTSISDLVTSTADFARLGYSLPDASKLAEVATLYKNVGDGINISDASQSIISTMKAFNVEATDSISIVDKLNEVGNNYAISSAGIGEALKRSASAMASANNTLDQTIALVTSANKVVQDPEMVGKKIA